MERRHSQKIHASLFIASAFFFYTRITFRFLQLRQRVVIHKSLPKLSTGSNIRNMASFMKSRFLLNNIRDTVAWAPRMFFCILQSPAIIWPWDPPWGSWNIVMDKKLFTNSCKVFYTVQIPIKSDQISPSISNYEIK